MQWSVLENEAKQWKLEDRKTNISQHTCMKLPMFAVYGKICAMRDKFCVGEAETFTVEDMRHMYVIV